MEAKSLQSGVIQVMHGYQTFPRSMTRCNVSAVGEDGMQKYANKVLKSISMNSRFADAEQLVADYGQWYTTQLENQDEVYLILSLFATLNGSNLYNSEMLLRLRGTGPLLCVKAKTAISHKSAFDTIPMFMGRADIVDKLPEIKMAPTTFRRNQLAKLIDVRTIEESFIVDQLDNGLEPRHKPVAIKGRGGEEKVAMVRQRRRRMRIRK